MKLLKISNLVIVADNDVDIVEFVALIKYHPIPEQCRQNEEIEISEADMYMVEFFDEDNY